MADAIVGEDACVRNVHPKTFPNPVLPEHWADLPGLVNDPLVDEDAQVTILSRVDETGSAALGDLAALLVDYPKPVKAVLQLVRHGLLTADPGVVDANTIIRRRDLPAAASGGNGDGGGDGGDGPFNPSRKGRLHRLRIAKPQAEIFCAQWSDRAVFRTEAMLERPGIYLAMFADAVYVGRSGSLSGRLVASNHLLEHGWPDMVIAAVDRNDVLTEAQFRVAERMMAQEVERHGVLRLANRQLPVGDDVDMLAFGQVDRFVREVIGAVAKAGLAFLPPTEAAAETPTPHPAAVAVRDPLLPAATATTSKAEGQLFNLAACGVHATARIENGRFVVKSGSLVRTEVLRSAGNGPLRQRQELLHDGGLAQAGRCLVLTRDVAFDGPSSAARFVVGVGHKGRVWRPVPQIPLDGSPAH
ncbi:DUF4357 domain-containing protein [Devosia albogilva]|uniref:DUF4357 domain-containing protein n=1 Tax=Devosia albogilva TaxID=429726 RepID=A0ABW5QM48_9HYPH